MKNAALVIEASNVLPARSHMYLRFASSTAVLATILTVVSAQQPAPSMPPPAGAWHAPRHRRARIRPGEIRWKVRPSLRGYVVAANTGSPLRRALVRAFSADGRGTGMAFDRRTRPRFEDNPRS